MKLDMNAIGIISTFVLIMNINGFKNYAKQTIWIKLYPWTNLHPPLTTDAVMHFLRKYILFTTYHFSSLRQYTDPKRQCDKMCLSQSSVVA